MVFKNFKYYYRELVDDVADVIWNVCSTSNVTGSRESAAVPLKHKIVLHTGPWDLSLAGARRFIRDPMLGLPKLFNQLEKLLDGSTACSAVSEIIWILAVPHPLCFDDIFMPDCNNHRSYRFNPAFAAANSLILKFLFKLRSLEQHSQSPIKLTIIDAFSMIKPRLAFNEDAEVACLSHFMCRIVWDNKDTSTVFTLGGKAMMDAVIHAIASP